MISKRARALVVAIFVGVAIAAVGIFPWSIAVALNRRWEPRVPWCVAIGVIWLCIFWAYTGGKGAPRSLSETRRGLRRARRLTGSVAVWSAVVAVSGVIAVILAYLSALHFVNLPANAFRPRGLASLPFVVVLALLLVTAVVAGVVEEVAYRGYMQGILEQCFSLPVAITVTTVVFTGAHLLGGKELWPLAIPVAAASTLFGALAGVTRSIIPPIIAHVATDAATLPLEWGLIGHLPSGRFHTNGLDAHLSMLVIAAVLFSFAAGVELLKLREFVRRPVLLDAA